MTVGYMNACVRKTKKNFHVSLLFSWSFSHPNIIIAVQWQ